MGDYRTLTRYQMGVSCGFFVATFRLHGQDYVADVREIGDTYDLLIVHSEGESAIRCDICAMISFSPGDVIHRYCGNCHFFHRRPQ